MSSLITLAFWQLRATWRLLLLAGAGMVIAAVLVCTLPLYSEVALSAGLRAVLNASPANSTLTVQGSLQDLSPDTVSQATQQLQQSLQRNLGTYLDQQPQFSAQVQRADIYPGNPAQNPTMQVGDSAVALLGFAQSQLPSHITLLQGRLPRPEQSVTEIALTPQTAQQMHVSVGDTIYVASPLTLFVNGSSSSLTWQLRVVGLFIPRSASDPFWQGNTFNSQLIGTANTDSYVYSALVSNESLFAALANTAATYPAAQISNSNQPVLSWSYHFNVSQTDAAHLNALVNGLNTFTSTAANLGSTGGVIISNVAGPDNVLNQYSTRASLAQLPQGVLLLLVIGMVLLFIGLMINLLIEQRAEAIAVLRERGASRGQIFGAFTTQAILLGLPVLIIGPLLAIPLARLLAWRLLLPMDQPALSLIGGNPLSVAIGLWPFSLAATCVTALSIILALFQATKFDVLALRNEAGRPRRRPFWQRFYLDVLCLVLALASYGYTFYVNQTTALGAQTSALVISPLVLLSSALFLLALLLLFLRFFAGLTAQASSLAARRGRSAGSMLALAQIARTPRQATRILLLLTLTTAFAFFALIFSASQTTRINDIASYEVGADFSGRLLNSQAEANAPVPNYRAVQTALAQQTAQYRAIHGVVSASMGYMGAVFTPQSSQLTIKAVDANTFASTAAWNSQDSQQSLASLMAELVSMRAGALANHVVPAIVDAATWDSLRLSNGKRFVLQVVMPDPNNSQGTLSTSIAFVAVARVEHIPTLSDSGSSLDPTSNGGILVDYLSCADGYAHASPIAQPLPISYVWLRTNHDPASLASVRAALAKRIAPGFTLADRLALIATLEHDPISIDLGGVLALGTFTPLILAVIGSLLASWQSVRSRLLSFVLLRALGTTPRQLASVLSWEQGTIYLLMFGLGILAGVLLSAMVLPILVVTSIANASTSGSAISSGVSLQQILPSIRVVIPPTLGVALAALALVCIAALGTMVRTIIRPSVSQILRLNAD
ncbi:MAG TPA: FtsX-like permease family protein [Ktedonobacteraceae bacterium]|nr:FtsX-like permease family protein [Ktedonobacteraceae bacterium]